MGLWSFGKPAFAGSDEIGPGFKPIFNFRRQGEKEWLSLPSDHGGPALYRSEAFRFGPSINIESPRKAGDHAALAGLDDVARAFEGGIFAELWPGPTLRTRAELRRGFGGHEGVIANLSADLVLKPDQRWTFTFGPRLALADAAYLGAYFGVTEAQSTASGLRTFEPKGGLYSAGVGASVKLQWNESWATLGYAQLDRLIGNAGDSPITALGAESQVTVGIGVAYTTSWQP